MSVVSEAESLFAKKDYVKCVETITNYLQSDIYQFQKVVNEDQVDLQSCLSCLIQSAAYIAK